MAQLRATAERLDAEQAHAAEVKQAEHQAQVKNLQLEQQLRLEVARKALENSVATGDAKVRAQSVRDAFDLGDAVVREHFSRSLKEMGELERELNPTAKPNVLLLTAAKRNGVDLDPPPTLVSG